MSRDERNIVAGHDHCRRRRVLVSTARRFPAPLSALRPCGRPAGPCRGDHFTADHNAMPFAVALDAFDTGIQPSAVTLLAGDRYFFMHGSSFSPASSHIAQMRSTSAFAASRVSALPCITKPGGPRPMSKYQGQRGSADRERERLLDDVSDAGHRTSLRSARHWCPCRDRSAR